MGFRWARRFAGALRGVLRYLFCATDSSARRSSLEHDPPFPPGSLQYLAAGKTGIVYAIDSERVWKEFESREDGEVERRVYKRLGLHPNIAKLLLVRADGSIILERGTAIRDILRDCRATDLSITTKVDWLIGAARGYQYLHDNAIIHGDVGCNNLILARDGNVKLIDFEGCSIDGGTADSCYEWFSYRRADPYVSRTTDIFAFGCAVYEIITGKPPYHEFESLADCGAHVQQLYAACQFPDVAGVPLSNVIEKCWHGGLESMDAVIQNLEVSKANLKVRGPLH
ncbi:kinase-like protein [Pseudovirgaria hyperparasitica]|uniref:Kinase-like protein n=1 Tax=Pseudovirgaria hyperparasitica TaxID=470096 RepID=A0A6A6W441_9PEZI|nr:kinase-like protein [Pseudovirgaria hyperparasitica]KAF2755811.1 kinase-like protein [Pseudovirgaria hyperparasitica]